MSAQLLSTLALAVGPAWLSFATAEVDLDGIDRLVVPHDAKIIHVPKTTRLTIQIRRHLALFVSPPLFVPDAMGCAERRVDRTLRLSIFGVWRTTEGTASIQLRLLVPDGVEVVRSRNRPSTKPLPGWTPVSEAPDPSWSNHWPDDIHPITEQPGDYPRRERFDSFLEDGPWFSPR